MRNLIIFIFITQSIITTAQPTFQRTYDVCNDALGLLGTEIDDGYLILSSSAFVDCISLMVIDSVGDVIRSNEFSYLPTLNVRAWDDTMVKDDDGNILVFGTARDSTFWDSYLMKISIKSLDTIWTKRIRTDARLERGIALKKYKDGYLALAETSTPIRTGPNSFFLSKIEIQLLYFDKDGNLLSDQIVDNGYPYTESGNFVVLDDGNLAIVHDSGERWLRYKNYISFIDSNFVIQKTILNEEIFYSETVASILKSKDNQTIYSWAEWRVPQTNFGDNTSRYYAYDLDGNVIWHQDFFTVGYEIFHGDIAQNDDIIICGTDQPSSGKEFNSGRISRMDAQGNVLWDRLYTDPFDNGHLSNVIETSDGGILAVGFVRKRTGISPDIHIMKLNANGCLKPACDSIIFDFPYSSSPPPQTSSVETTTAQAVDIQLYPNPAAQEITFSIQNNRFSNLLLKISNPLGQLMMSENNIESEQPINISKLRPGAYHYSIYDANQHLLKSGSFLKVE